MNIGIDTSNLKNESSFRGIGSYTRLLINELVKNDKQNTYQTADILDKKVDLQIIPFFFPYQMSLPLIKKTKTIIVIHDLIPLKFPDHFPVGIKGRLILGIQQFLLKANSDLIITDSLVSKKDIIELLEFSENKIEVIYPAVDPAFKQINYKVQLEETKKKYNLSDKFILYTGDCNWNKNIHSLIKACKFLNLELILAGKVFTDKSVDFTHPWNISIKEVKDIAKSYPKVKMIGYVPQEDLINLYNLAYLYIQPSYYEGFGLPVIEAMACGCPVVCSNAGSLIEIADRAAEIFNPKNINELIKKISSINEDRRQALISKGFNQAKKFTPKLFVESYTKVYEKIF